MPSDSPRPAAFVTGASRGIGRAIAVTLASSGFDVALNARSDSPALREAVRLVEAAGAEALPVVGDIGALDEHAAMLDAVYEAFGNLRWLVNNAGVSVLNRGDLLDVSRESYDRCLDTNTRGTFFLSQAAARRMLDEPEDPTLSHRSIVFVTSANAVAASVLRGEYCLSKTALSMTAKLFGLRLAADGIGVYEIQPGLIETDMIAPSRDRYLDQIEQGLTAIKRLGRPEDVASVAVAAATGRLAYTVGQEIRVDGGLLVAKF